MWLGQSLFAILLGKVFTVYRRSRIVGLLLKIVGGVCGKREHLEVNVISSKLLHYGYTDHSKLRNWVYDSV